MKMRQVSISATVETPHSQGGLDIVGLGEDGNVYYFMPEPRHSFWDGTGCWLPSNMSVGSACHGSGTKEGV